MNQFSRYLLRNLVVATFCVTAGLAAAIWMTQSLRLVELVVEGGAPLSVFLRLALLTFPTFLALILPIGLMVAVLFTYNRLILDSELVVMRAAGMGPLALARPALLLALIVTLACYALTLYVAPAAQRELIRQRQQIRTEYSTVLLREGTFNDLGEGLTIYVRERRGDGELTGLVIHDVREPGVRTTVVADRGLLLDVEGSPRVVVFNGTQMKFHSADARLEWLEFARYTVDLQMLRQGLQPRWPDPRERTVQELITISQDPLDRQFAHRLRAELHSRLAMPLLSLAFTAVSLMALLSGEFSRRGQARRIVMAGFAGLALESAVLGVANMVGKSPPLTPLLYVIVLLPVAAALWHLGTARPFRRGLRSPLPAE